MKAKQNPPVVLLLCRWTDLKIVQLIYSLVKGKNTSHSCFYNMNPLGHHTLASKIKHWMSVKLHTFVTNFCMTLWLEPLLNQKDFIFTATVSWTLCLFFYFFLLFCICPHYFLVFWFCSMKSTVSEIWIYGRLNNLASPSVYFSRTSLF